MSICKSLLILSQLALCALAWARPLYALDPFVPNDPYFYTNNPEGFPGQWHLDKQTSGAVVDVNIRGAWEQGITGEGVVIGIIDCGVQINSHPDLSANGRADLSWDFYEDVAHHWTSAHGTAAAGVAAGRGGNGIGVTGAAPYAGVASLRWGTGNFYQNERLTYDGIWASAIQYESEAIAIKNSSWGWPESLKPLPSTEAAIQNTAAGGMVNVFCAHNWRDSFGGFWGNVASPDTNRSACTHLPGEIVVSGVGREGVFASYSDYGASVTVTAPTWGGRETLMFGIITTDMSQDGRGYNSTPDVSDGDPFPDMAYTSAFTGTSASAPIVSGVLALAKQVQPNLDVRFAKHLLARTSRIVDPTDATSVGGWSTNGAGYHFNNNYGFGLIDADALTRAAVQYSGVTPLALQTTDVISVGTTIPSNNPTGVTRDFVADFTGALEEVEVTLNMGSFLTNDLQAVLTSPDGTQSMILCANGANDQSSAASSWSVTSNAFWGETPAGTWHLALLDADGGYDSSPLRWDSFSITFHSGELIAVPEPGTLGLAAAAFVVVWCVRRRRRQVETFPQSVALGYRVCPRWGRGVVSVG